MATKMMSFEATPTPQIFEALGVTAVADWDAAGEEAYSEFLTFCRLVDGGAVDRQVFRAIAKKVEAAFPDDYVQIRENGPMVVVLDVLTIQMSRHPENWGSYGFIVV